MDVKAAKQSILMIIKLLGTDARELRTWNFFQIGKSALSAVTVPTLCKLPNDFVSNTRQSLRCTDVQFIQLN